MYDHAVGAGRFILAPTRYHADHSIATPLLEFSPTGRYAAQIQAFKDQLRGSSADDDETFSVLDVEHNDTYACASIFVLLMLIPELFACESPPNHPLGIAQLLELDAQSNIVPPAFTKREYVERALTLVDNIAEEYNTSVFVDRVITFENVVPGLGKTEDLVAPRPWVIMQIIQMRQERIYDHNGDIFNGCVSNPPPSLSRLSRPACFFLAVSGCIFVVVIAIQPWMATKKGQHLFF